MDYLLPEIQNDQFKNITPMFSGRQSAQRFVCPVEARRAGTHWNDLLDEAAPRQKKQKI